MRLEHPDYRCSKAELKERPSPATPLDPATDPLEIPIWDMSAWVEAGVGHFAAMNDSWVLLQLACVRINARFSYGAHRVADNFLDVAFRDQLSREIMTYARIYWAVDSENGSHEFRLRLHEDPKSGQAYTPSVKGFELMLEHLLEHLKNAEPWFQHPRWVA